MSTLGFQCPVCLKDCEQDDEYNELPCRHKFHKECIRPWLLKVKTSRVCKSDQGILEQFSDSSSWCGLRAAQPKHGTFNVEVIKVFSYITSNHINMLGCIKYFIWFHLIEYTCAFSRRVPVQFVDTNFPLTTKSSRPCSSTSRGRNSGRRTWRTCTIPCLDNEELRKSTKITQSYFLYP